MSTMSILMAAAAQASDQVTHVWRPDGGWAWWGPIIPLLWLLFIIGAIWFVTRRLRPRERTGAERARDILAERFARGDITGEEYRDRLSQLQ
ncbi:MAG: SHOCT domain-containing protein [Chloroflexota bacterium]|nr:SHOCT domain-containing protein [Chloroflexota bacterium]